jgi:transposase-like protein
MGRPKGKSNKSNRHWSKEDKYEYVKLILEGHFSMTQIATDNDISVGMLSTWVKKYNEGGLEALENYRKQRNPLIKYQRRKTLTPYEHLEYENAKLRIENERLKKGYTEKEVKAIRRKQSSKTNSKS